MASVISELDEQNHATSILSNLVEMLHFCDVVEEAYEVFDFAAEQLFPTGGSIEFVDDASGVMQAKCVWGDRTTWSVVSSHGAWRLRAADRTNRNWIPLAAITFDTSRSFTLFVIP